MKKSSFKERLIKSSFWSFISSTVNRIGAIVFIVVITRLLGLKGFGIYSIALSVAMIFYTFADLGINETLLRYISSSLSEDRKKVSAYFNYIFKLKFILAIISSSLLLLLSYPLAFFVFRNSALFYPLLAASFYIFVLSFEGFYSKIFFSVEKLEYFSLKEAISQVIKIVLVFLVFYFVSEAYRVSGIFILLTLCTLIVTLLTLYFIKKLLPEVHKETKVEIEKKRIIRFLGFLTLISIANGFFTYLDAIILGVFTSPEYVGFYRSASSLVFGVISIAGGFIIPLLLPMYTKEKESRLKILIPHLFRFVCIFIIPPVFALIVLGKYFIVYLFGYQYMDAYLSLVILSPLVFEVLTVNFFTPLFAAKEKPQLLAKITVFISIVNALLGIIFIKIALLHSHLLATVGMALATLFSWLFYVFFVAAIIKKEFGIKLGFFNSLLRPVIASIVMSLYLLICLNILKDMNLFFGVLLIITGAIVYLISIFALRGIKKEDLNVLRFKNRNGKNK